MSGAHVFEVYLAGAVILSVISLALHGWHNDGDGAVASIVFALLWPFVLAVAVVIGPPVAIWYAARWANPANRPQQGNPR